MYKVMAPELVTIQYYPKLRGCVLKDGWVDLHNTSVSGQRSSKEALLNLHRLGFNFDIITNDGNKLEDVNINDVHIKIEYNINPNIETLPKNGIKMWRLSSNRTSGPELPRPPIPGTEGWKVEKSGVLSISDQLLQQSFETVGVRVSHYANDKYKREIKPGVWIDVYDIIECYKPNNAALEHALKKILAAGKRGHKDFEQDLIDILSSVERALFQHQEKNK